MRRPLIPIFILATLAFSVVMAQQPQGPARSVRVRERDESPSSQRRPSPTTNPNLRSLFRSIPFRGRSSPSSTFTAIPQRW